MRFSETGLDPQVRVKGNLTIEPAFGDGGIHVPMDNIARLHPHVSDDLVESFQAFYVYFGRSLRTPSLLHPCTVGET